MEKKTNSVLIGLLVYLVVVVGVPLAKLAGLPALAGWSWWRATCLAWGPWLLVVLCLGGVLLFKLLEASYYALFKKKPHA